MSETNKYLRAVEDLMKSAEAIFIRKTQCGGHLIWRLPNGATVTVAHTPSHKHALNDVKRYLRRAAAQPNRTEQNRS